MNNPNSRQNALNEAVLSNMHFFRFVCGTNERPWLVPNSSSELHSGGLWRLAPTFTIHQRQNLLHV